MTSEFENRNIHFLFVQPLKKTSIIHSKIWSSVLIYLIMTVVLISTAWLISTLFGSPGTFAYPILIRDATGFAFLPMHQYIIAIFALISSVALLVIGLTMWWSLLVKHSLATLFGVLVILVVGYVMTSMIHLPASVNPFPDKVLAKSDGASVVVGYSSDRRSICDFLYIISRLGEESEAKLTRKTSSKF